MLIDSVSPFTVEVSACLKRWHSLFSRETRILQHFLSTGYGVFDRVLHILTPMTPMCSHFGYAEDIWVFLRLLLKIHSSHQYLEDLHWFEGVFKTFGRAVFEAIEVKGLSEMITKFNIDGPLTSMTSKTAESKFLKIASNQCKSSKYWWEVWILGRGRKKTKCPQQA